MLHKPMRTILMLTALVLLKLGMAQVTLDTPLRFTGDEGQRGIDGIAPPAEPTSVITAGYAASGAQHWAEAVLVGDTLELSTAVPPSAYAEGTLLRFTLTAGRVGRTFVRVGALPAVPLLRSDGLNPVLGDLQRDGVNEILHSNGRFIILSALNSECPVGSVRVNDKFCIQTSRRSQLTFPQAVDYCADRGGRLCTWDEYYAGCVLVGNQLQNLHSDWEWLNDMSDHVHSADQVARTTCTSQRATFPANPGTARCCYSLR